MPAASSVLVVGAGTAGPAVSALLCDVGVRVDLVEVMPGVTALGSGLTVQGNALRVLDRLGVWPQAAERGYGFDSVGLRAPDREGTLLAEIDDVRSGGPDLPATLGIHRPDLARILMDRALAAGTSVRFSTTVTSLAQDERGVDVSFSDGTSGRYDLVIGADGIRSPMRAMLGIDVRPQAVGMGIWRAFTARPAGVTRTDLYYGGPCYIAGYCPTGSNALYCYLVEPAQDRSHLTPDEQLDTMRRLSRSYHGPWDDIRELLTDPSRVNYTHFETHLVPAPWNRGRVVLIGDAAHSCPPTIAQGAALALEDAAVLAELVAGAGTLDERLWSAFTARRFDRVQLVVDASNQMARWQLDRERGDVPGLLGKVMSVVAQPA